MNIKRIIDKNGKLIWYIGLIIIFVLLAIKSLNSYYEVQEQKKQAEMSENILNSDPNKNEIIDYSTESTTVKKTIASFVNYCNKRELENAYKMLTDECKNAMFPSIEYFEKLYINNIYNVERTFEVAKWATDGNKSIFLVTLYGDILATGKTDNYIQEYYTFVKNDKGMYKININNYIYGEDRNLESTVNNIKVKIGHVDIYEEYQIATITIINNSLNTICLTGNKFKEKIYLQNSTGITYSSLNSEFDYKTLILEAGKEQTFKVQFNKEYSATNKPQYLVLSDVILDYNTYLNSENKTNYSNRTSIKVKYQ